MSGKDSSFARRRTRRQTNDALRTAAENENEDTKRFIYFFRKYSEEYNFPYASEINNYLVKEDGQCIEIEWPFMAGKDLAQDELTPIINTYCDMDLSLRKVICKSPHIDTRTLVILNKTILNFAHLFTIRLDYCDLTSEQIELLAENIQSQPCIKDLSLKGNPNQEQNFYLFIRCRLKKLNLKLCGINECGLEKMAEEFLKNSLKSILIHLDLSSNMVFNEGCKHIARILRCDRTLQSLNLSDCKISDDGFEDIINSFQKFFLYDDELYVRRKLRFEYFKQLEKGTGGYCVDKKVSLPHADNEQLKDPLTIAEEKLTKHPFTSESVQEDEDNHLSKASFELILKTLMEQSSAFGYIKGLNRIVLDGNPDMQKSENVRNAIEEFLLGKKARKSINGNNKVRVSLKRRKSSASSSVTSEKSKEVSLQAV